ncbi:MAG TPA: diacylglycerol kinase family protein [Actinomycetota bacterium]|nr:diacylglycerol kinase family protein [Actinomycetota bacterium]
MSSPFGELTVIVNPHAGKRRVGKEVPELERTLRARGLRYQLLRTEGRGDAVRFAREALESGARFLVAVGGDGTVHEVVNGMLDADGRPVGDAPVLGVVAAGSGCDFIRTFGLPGDATRACFHLTGDNLYPLDVGKITYTTVSGDTDHRFFVNVAEAGLGAAVAARAERMSPRLGQSKYFFGFWLTLPRFKLATVRVEADRKTYEGSAYLVVIGNAQYYGGGMKVSPRSYPGDGVLDVLVFKGPKSDAFTLIPKIYRGEHVPNAHVEEFRVRRRLVIEADRPLPIEADGEVLGTTSVVVEVVPQPIRMKL